MLKIVQEGKIDVFLKSDVAMTAGQLVKLDPANLGKVILAGAGDDVHGMVAQDVVDRNVDNFKLDSVTHKAFKGEKVGIYNGGGQYYTDQTASAVTYGAKLYPAAGGKMSTTASGNAVAVAEGNAGAGQKVLIRSLLA